MINKRNRIIILLFVTAILALAADYWFIRSSKTDIEDNIGSNSSANIIHNHDKTSENKEHENEYYTCPMHPSVVSDKPGSCPICGMTLVKKTRNTQKINKSSTTDLSDVSLSPSQQVLANVTLDTVKRKKINKEITTIGKITYNEKTLTNLTPWISGRVDKLYINTTGEFVSKGEKILEIYSPDLYSAQQEYIQAYESYLNLKSSSFKDISEGVVSLLEASKKKLLLLGIKESQINELEKTKKPRVNESIFATSSGFILKKNVQQGQYVNTGEVLFEVADLSRVWAEIYIYEYEISNIKEGQTVEISTVAYPDKIFTGKISYIYPFLEQDTKTVKVRVELINQELKLKPAMTVTAKLIINLGNPLVVAKTAVLATGKKSIVWIEKKANVYIPKEVKTGQTVDDYYIIQSGLKDGEKVVVSGGFLLDSESQISTMSGMDMSGMKMEKKSSSAPKDPETKENISHEKKQDDMDMSNLKMGN